MSGHRLHHGLAASARRWPQRVAVEDVEGRRLSYSQLHGASQRLAVQLRDAGVQPGDRIGLCLPKSLSAVAAIYAVSSCGAAYVPLDTDAPIERNAFIAADCAMAGVIVASDLQQALWGELGCLGFRPTLWIIDVETASGSPDDMFETPLPFLVAEGSAAARAEARGSAEVDDLAYILYTSGSTGRPKGVMLSHRNADAFLGWCSRTFEPRPEDRFASHAPLHFDLSILDVHLPLRHGARVVLIDAASGRDPVRLAPLIAAKRLTIWYSAPSTLALLAQLGRLERQDLSCLRLVLFAGEVFPIRHLRRLVEQVPAPRYFNLYGPTETNVCTFHEIPRPIAEQRRRPFPIGRPCDGAEVLLLDDGGRVVDGEGRGELLVRGDTVTAGYWNLPSANAEAFWNPENGITTAATGVAATSVAATGAWYRTGDWVHRDADGLLHFLGRRDRLVKRRGFRIELDEIEACLYRHRDVAEAAVVAHGDDDGVRIEAVLQPRHGADVSVLELRQFVHRHLPSYMCPDRFRVGGPLPRTSTGKVDYTTLQGAL